MEMSASIDKITLAMFALQAEIQNIPNDTEGYGYWYVKLPTMLDILRPLCNKHDMVFSQFCTSKTTAPDVVGVTTMLIHNSGQYMRSTCYMKVIPDKGSHAQGAGKVITYLRRYTLAAMFSLAQVDNDASIKEIGNKVTATAQDDTEW